MLHRTSRIPPTISLYPYHFALAPHFFLIARIVTPPLLHFTLDAFFLLRRAWSLFSCVSDASLALSCRVHREHVWLRPCFPMTHPRTLRIPVVSKTTPSHGDHHAIPDCPLDRRMHGEDTTRRKTVGPSLRRIGPSDRTVLGVLAAPLFFLVF
jgi:hypothetical protein